MFFLWLGESSPYFSSIFFSGSSSSNCHEHENCNNAGFNYDDAILHKVGQNSSTETKFRHCLDRARVFGYIWVSDRPNQPGIWPKTKLDIEKDGAQIEPSQIETYTPSEQLLTEQTKFGSLKIDSSRDAVMSFDAKHYRTTYNKMNKLCLRFNSFKGMTTLWLMLDGTIFSNFLPEQKLKRWLKSCETEFH